MSVKSSIEGARERVRELQEAVQALHLTVSQDRPGQNEAALVDWLDDAVTELAGSVEGASGHLGRVLQSELREGPLPQARDGLCGAQELLNQFTERYLCGLAEHQRLTQLARMGRERGKGWNDWVQVVKGAIGRCAKPLLRAQEALLDCWRELGEALARNSVSVNATNIGQQIQLRKDQLEWAGKAT